MSLKRVSDKQKPVDKTVSMRISPIAAIQLDVLQDYTGENASRVIVRAIDNLYNYYVASGASIPLNINLKKKKKEKS